MLPAKCALRHKDLRKKKSPGHRTFIPRTSDIYPPGIGSVSPGHRIFVPRASDRCPPDIGSRRKAWPTGTSDRGGKRGLPVSIDTGDRSEDKEHPSPMS